MPPAIITLTTDFGTSDSYVAQLKGTILAVNPDARLVDVTHAIPAQDLPRGAIVLEEIVQVFPAGTIHVAVVDPGVGSDRAVIGAEAAGQRFLAPDNGLLSLVFRWFPPTRVHRLAENRFWRNPVSATFHGRDILAPVAAHWSLGTDLAEFGPPIDVSTLVQLPSHEPQQIGNELVGRIESIDRFGNLITNIRDSQLPKGEKSTLSISVGGHCIIGLSRAYSDQARGALLALISSSGRLEIAINSGSAGRTLNIAPGAEVRIGLP